MNKSIIKLQCRIGCALIMCFSLVGCDSNNTSEIEFQETSIKVEADLSQDYPKSANVYRVEYYEVDEDIAVQNLMHNPFSEKTERAEGIQYLAGDVESLVIFNKAIRGGLAYFHHPNGVWKEGEPDIDSYKNWATKESVPSDLRMKTMEDEMLTFDARRELSFASQEEVEQEAETIMNVIGFPEAQLYEVMPRDKETLNANLSVYERVEQEAYEKEAESDDLESREPLTTTEYEFIDADEDYILSYRQVVDAIPFATSAWCHIGDTISTEQEIRFCYSVSGQMSEIYITNVYNVQETDHEIEVMSPGEAVQVYEEEYNKSFHVNETTLLSVELNYIVISANNELYAKPAWVLVSKTLVTDKYGTDSYEYDVNAINAETGAILQKVTDTR